MTSFAVLVGPSTWGMCQDGYGYSWHWCQTKDDPGDDVSSSHAQTTIWSDSWGERRDGSRSWSDGAKAASRP